MPEQPNRERRVAALMADPLSRGSMNAEHLGAMGTLCDISIPTGWIGIVERVYAALRAMPPEHRPAIAQIKEKFGSLHVYLSGEQDTALKRLRRVAEGESMRTCQVCGCRGHLAVHDGWWATLCASHREQVGKDPYNHRRAQIPGVDDSRDDWAVDAVPQRDGDRPHTTIAAAALMREGSGLSTSMPDILIGLIEPEALVVARDPMAVLSVFSEPPPFAIQSAHAALVQLADKSLRNPTLVLLQVDRITGTDTDIPEGIGALWRRYVELAPRLA